MNIVHPHSRLDDKKEKNFISNRVVKEWNEIQSDDKMESSISAYKTYISKVSGFNQKLI